MSEVGMAVTVLGMILLGVWIYASMRVLYKRDARAWKERW